MLQNTDRYWVDDNKLLSVFDRISSRQIHSKVDHQADIFCKILKNDRYIWKSENFIMYQKMIFNKIRHWKHFHLSVHYIIYFEYLYFKVSFFQWAIYWIISESQHAFNGNVMGFYQFYAVLLVTAGLISSPKQ